MILEVKLRALDLAGTARTCRFMIDTGCTTCIIDSSLPPSLFWEDGSFFEASDAMGGKAQKQAERFLSTGTSRRMLEFISLFGPARKAPAP